MLFQAQPAFVHPFSSPNCVQVTGDGAGAAGEGAAGAGAGAAGAGAGAAELGDGALAIPAQIRLPSLIDIPQSLIEVQNVGNVVKAAHIISNPEEV